jgi:23S rRNA (guanosine2251-2'-O)-methyltransferase
MKRILAGPHAVMEAIRASGGAIEVIFVVDSMRSSATHRIEEMARRFNVSLEMVPKAAMDKMASQVRHQGVVAITGAYPYLDLDGLLRFSRKVENPLIVVLDQVQDPRNLGAIMRSAYAFGATGLVIPRDRAARVTAAAVRASAGASELVKTVRVVNLVRTVDTLRDEGYHVVGAAVDGDRPVQSLDWQGPTVLVLGSEGKGLRRLTARHCDELFVIPIVHDFDSLNVSAAAAIALFEAFKKRSWPG